MSQYLENFDASSVPSPSYVVDQEALLRNMRILKAVQDKSGAKILLALKGFAMFNTFPIIKDFLAGVCSSSPNESILGSEEFGKEVHAFAPAYKKESLAVHLDLCDHIIFNSYQQWLHFQEQVNDHPKNPSIGLRVNPMHSEADIELYNPCAPGSRLGILPEQLKDKDLRGIEGFHFHSLCQKGADTLQRTANSFEKHFGQYLHGLKWLNFGGGHYISHENYDRELLCEIIEHFQTTYDLQVYLEPGEAIAINTGVLITTVLDIVENDGFTAILDVSPTCHMPDVLEMPYRPEIRGAGLVNQKKYTYRLGGVSCLAGDIIGEYSFDQPLEIGQRLILDDMSQYTMVKTTMFNGLQHPAICLYNPLEDELNIFREFGYEDYRQRLGSK